MLKQLMLGKKLEQGRAALAELLKENEVLATRSKELEAALDEAKTDEEIALVEEQVEAMEADEATLAEKKSKLEAEIARIEGELDELKSKEPPIAQRDKGADKMEDKELRKRIAMYVRSKGRIALREDDSGDDNGDVIEGFKVVDGGILVPEEILAPEEKKREVVDLAKYVRNIKVNRGSGKIPIIKKSGGKFISTNELEKNPELAKPQIDDVPYDITTYRGYIPVSQEVIDDADYDITGMIASDIADQELNTRNAEIADVLKDAEPEEVTSLDGLKEVLNVKLKRVYNAKLIMSASLYHELDTAKDKLGRYLLQDSITSPSGKSFAGREIIVLDDDVIGDEAGDLVAFVGDAREYCALFDRKRASVKWIDHNIYGELLAGFVRFDVGKVDEDAGFYVKWGEGEPGLGLLIVSTVAGSVAEGDTVLTVTGDEGGQLAYKVASTHTIVTYGKKAVAFTKLPEDFESPGTITLKKDDNNQVITVVELDHRSNVVRAGSGALLTYQG